MRSLGCSGAYTAGNWLKCYKRLEGVGRQEEKYTQRTAEKRVIMYQNRAR